jgi:hypothetical protein
MRCCMTLCAALLALIAFGPAQAMAKGPADGGGGGGGKDNQPSGVHAGSGNPSGGHHAGAGSGTAVNPGVHPNTGGAGVGQPAAGAPAPSIHPNAGGDGVRQHAVGAPAPSIRPNTGAAVGLAKGPHQTFDAQHRPDFSGGPEGRDSWRYRWNDGRWLFWGSDNRWMWYGDDGRWVTYGTLYVVQRPIVGSFSGGPIKIVNPAESGVTLSYSLDGSDFTMAPGSSQEFQEDRAWAIQFSRGEGLDQARYGLQSGVYTFARTDRGVELYRSEFAQTVAPPPAPAAPVNPR